MTTSRRQWIAFAGVLAVTVTLGARGLTDESAVMLIGDMARYAMNGVFLHDFIADGGAWSVDELTMYAERYYARYPALSLGHHPPLLYVALVPFYWIFGISMFPVRLAALAFFVLAATSMYFLAKRFFGWPAAVWATLLFVTNTIVLRAGQNTLSEMPMLAFILVALNALLVYCETRKTKHFVGFILAVVASMYAKQLAAFMIPVYAVVIVQRLGWRHFLERRVVVAALAGALLTAPLVAMTLAFSPANVNLASGGAVRLVTGAREKTVWDLLGAILWTHLTSALLLIVAAGAAVLAVRRDRFFAIGSTWILAVVCGTVVLGVQEPARYAFAVMPAYFLFAAGPAGLQLGRRAQWIVVAVLSGGLLWQAWLVRDVRPSGAGGYEEAAQYVVGTSSEPVVLVDTFADTGYLVFFVRKHDPDRRLVLLRADKVLQVRNRGGTVPPPDPERLYSALRKFGIRFVVVEERATGPGMLRLLHSELKTDRFTERHRIPITTRERRVQGADLVIYEFKEAQPPDLDAELDIWIRLAGREIALRLRDLVGTGSGTER